MKTKKIIFAGGPGTGKTSVLKELKKEGYCCFEEVSRQVTLAAKQMGITQLFLKDPLLFSQKLLERRIEQFKKAEETNSKFCFYDRGIPEVSAYMEYKAEEIPDFFKKAQQIYKYDLLFYFPIWDEIYTPDNERYESLSEAKIIDTYIRKAYINLGYSLIEVPKTNLKNRKEFIFEHL